MSFAKPDGPTAVDVIIDCLQCAPPIFKVWARQTGRDRSRCQSHKSSQQRKKNQVYENDLSLNDPKEPYR